MGIRTRIFIIILSCLLLGISLAFVVAERDLSLGIQNQIETELSHEAKILVKAIGSISSNGNLISLKSQIDEYSEASESRITLIDSSGIVLVDSDVTMNEVLLLENHLNRPEVIKAFEVGQGSSKRFSDTTNQEMLYFAILDSSNDKDRVIRISVPYEYLDEILATLENSITLIVVVGIIVSILASLLAGNYMRSSLVDLEKVASAIGEGNYKKKDLKSLPVGRSDEIGSVARDISSISTDLKNQISLITKQRNQFGAVLDGLGEGILMCDQDGIISFRNDFILQIFGFNEIVGLSIDELKISAISNMFKKAQKRGMFDDEFEIEDEDDKTRWILAHMNKSKATKGMILVVHDITQLRQMDSMRRDFVSNLSHELRTPVSVIKANSETLLDGALDDKKDAKTFSKAILHNANRLSEMVTSLIDLSRIEYGELKLVIKDIVLNDVVDSVLLAFKNKAKRKNINLKFERSSSISVKADTQAVERILNNLLDNAFKYSPDYSEVELRIRKQGEFVKISVLDSGEGVSDEDQRLVFKRFYRTAAARANTQQGSGLGLAIVRNLVNNLHGEVGVDSRLGVGSEFWFTLPVS